MTLNNDERELIRRLVTYPARPAPISIDEFLKEWGLPGNGLALSLELMLSAIDEKDPTDLECAMVVMFAVGVGEAHLPYLLGLAGEDWHRSHEDIVEALVSLGCPQSFDALCHLVEWLPEYLAWDDNRALASKALWGIAAIADPRVVSVLRQFSMSPDHIVRDIAGYQLERKGVAADAGESPRP